MQMRMTFLALVAALGVAAAGLAQDPAGAGDAGGNPQDGVFEVLDEQGVLLLREIFVDGKRHGAFFERSEEDGRIREGHYRDDALDGVVTVKRGRKTLSKQTWRRGRLVRLGRLRHPFPVAKSELLDRLAAIERREDEAGAADGDAADGDAADGSPVVAPSAGATEADALRRLQAYRSLCGLPWEEMLLVDAWNRDCAAAARVSQMNGRISHFPERPEGISDEVWRRAARGSRSSNLAAGSGMVGQVDGYMDDSDRSNIARLGHRRWCLNPAMKKTGFGAAGGYGAMWSFDSSGRGAKGLDNVLYPPRGYVPVDYFGSRHAWSVAILSGGRPDPESMRVEVFALDEHYVQEAEPLPMDYLGVAPAGQGTGPCIIFRPEVAVRPGRAYVVEIALDGGKRPDLRYLVEFCEPARTGS